MLNLSPDLQAQAHGHTRLHCLSMCPLLLCPTQKLSPSTISTQDTFFKQSEMYESREFFLN